ncbi:sulfotransferase 1 family member D1-like [Ptychodera flava]|uniref:sulfotransferase 1 family member D1-like n=1 Tax=Ptychodera flava TaxID=63121 RepID=UPI00396A26DF
MEHSTKPGNPRLVRFPYGKVKTMEIRHDDLFLISYPKSGTHWLIRIITSILKGSDIDATGRRASAAPFVEMLLTQEEDDPRLLMAKKNHGLPVDFNPSSMESPRFLNTHTPYDLLPAQFHEKRPKLIYLARNPKDLVVSAFIHHSMPPCHIYDEFSELLEEFLAGQAIANFGHWGSHVLDWWKRRHENNVLYVKYEDMRKDLKAGIMNIAEFIGKDLTTEDIDKIAHHCSFDYMKKAFQDDAFMKAMGWKENPFVRRGKVGGWKETFTVAQNEMMDKYCEQWLKGTGLEFKME